MPDNPATHCAWTGGQYSVYRALLGTWLLVRLLLLVPEHPARGLALAGAAGCAALIIGWYDRVAAAALVGIQAVLALTAAARDPACLSWMTTALALVLPACHLAAAPAPYGSWAARGRPDPAGTWHWPPGVRAGAWIGLILVYAVGGVSLLAPGRGAGPETGLGVFWLLCAVTLCPRRWDKWAWWATGAVNVILLPILGCTGLAIALALFHLLTFNPHWLPRASGAALDTVFYDGTCGLCHRWVRFVLSEDRHGDLFALSPLQGERIQASMAPEQRERLPDSIVVVCADGRVLVRSAAVLHILARLGGLWRVVAFTARLVPRPLRDAAYAVVAAWRARLFRRPTTTCPVVPPHLRARFLP